MKLTELEILLVVGKSLLEDILALFLSFFSSIFRTSFKLSKNIFHKIHYISFIKSHVYSNIFFFSYQACTDLISHHKQLTVGLPPEPRERVITT